MNKLSVLEEIKSKYAINNISSYIEKENYLLKLVNYYKKGQKKLGINLDNYKIIYYSKLINWKKYLSFDINNLYNFDYNKHELKDEFFKDMSEYKIDKKIYKKSICTFFKNYKNNENAFLEIDLFSPLFDILCKESFFENFYIQIPLFYEYQQKKIKNYFNYKIDLLNKLNKSHTNFSIICEALFFDDIKDFKIKFPSVKNIILHVVNKTLNKQEYNLINFHKIFPNVNNLLISVGARYLDYDSQSYLSNNFIINENLNCKINNITLNLINKNYITKLYCYCHSFKSLETINVKYPIYDIINNFINRKFESLTQFHYEYNNYIVSDNIIKICKIIDNMPNLKDFKFVCNFFDEDKYKMLIKKILSLEFIKKIYIKSDYNYDKDNLNYSKDELKEIYPNIKIDYLDEIRIEKFNVKSKIKDIQIEKESPLMIIAIILILLIGTLINKITK